MKKLITIVTLIFSTLIYSQESEDNTWALKLNTTQLVDIFSFPTLQVSAERKLNPYFSLNMEAGYQLYDPFKTDSVILKSRGFKTNLEGRFYISKFFHKRIKSKRNEPFIGLQIFYRKNQTTDILHYYPINDLNEDNEYIDHFGVKKTAVGFNIVFGSQFTPSKTKKFILEPYVGIGMVNRKIKNMDLQFDDTKYELHYGPDLDFQDSKLEKNSGNFVNLSIGLRIGYKL